MPDLPDPLGATPDGAGVSFALLSTAASRVELCLFDGPDAPEGSRHELARGPDDIWRVRLDGCAVGQLYGYRVHGPHDPGGGQRFNPRKLLIDPYARALAGHVRWSDASYGYDRASPFADLSFDARDSASLVPKGVVVAGHREPDARPRRPWRDTVIYEAHVKGLTRLHPDIPEPMRGTYAALGHPAVIAHLQRLGVTALELLPIHAFVDDAFLIERNLTNYWGYSTLNFFTPEPRYGRPEDLRGSIRALHAAGIEVILDVVYNHTAEADELGPTLSFRGIDNAGYYRLAADRRRYDNATGTGNTLDFSRSHVVRLAVDSLRHWAEAYGVDGFRFDLATVLGRDPHAFQARAAFFEAVARDPLLSTLKLIAEPWDIGEAGYRLGRFPLGWSEWNDRFRDGMRAFWRGDPGAVPDFVRGMAGSREIFEESGRGPLASINYVASHDGFTVRDAVSYADKHNEANREENRDGHGHNVSANGGVEGETDDAAIRAWRARGVRNLLASVFLAQGVPMLLAGDELSRTQAGNNNAYCQDNATSWLDWETGRAHDPELPVFVAHLTALRRRFDALRRETFFFGTTTGSGGKDVHWLAADGGEIGEEDWGERERRTLGMLFGDEAADGRRLLLLANAGETEVAFELKTTARPATWMPILDTTRPDGLVSDPARCLEEGGTFPLASRSLVLFTPTT